MYMEKTIKMSSGFMILDSSGESSCDDIDIVIVMYLVKSTIHIPN